MEAAPLERKQSRLAVTPARLLSRDSSGHDETAQFEDRQLPSVPHVELLLCSAAERLVDGDTFPELRESGVR
jgi:hypothetical protein